MGSLAETDLLSNLAVQVHGSIVFGSLRDIELFHDPIVDDTFTVGTAGDRIIELAACWAIVMTLTGYYLFFRVGRRGCGARPLPQSGRSCATSTASPAR